MNRRTFIEKSMFATAAFGSTLETAGSGGYRDLTPKNKIKAGLIGAGWYGMVISKAALEVGGIEVVAVCDVDTGHLKKSADELEQLQGTRPVTYSNYRDLINLAGLEAVFIASPPQWHALHFIAACEKGLAIYCEKPLSYDIMEGIAMVKAAEKAGNIVQIGFQRRQSSAFKYAKSYIKEGRAGDIHQINVQIHYQANPGDNTIQDPPASLDWDEWCGPAPKLEYRPSIGHFNWRLEKEYGNGHLVDWGIHNIDAIRCIMEDGIPSEFRTTGGLYALKGRITTPDTLTANMAFPKAPVVWQHRLWGTGDLNPEFNNGVFFHGDKSSIFVSDTRFVVRPAGRDAEITDIKLDTEGGMQELHMADFLKALTYKDPGLISCTVQDAFLSTATVQLAMIAFYTGSIVKWDAKSNQITGNTAAAGLLRREYRGKWQHPG
jgi:predicted dehydrogenase